MHRLGLYLQQKRLVTASKRNWKRKCAKLSFSFAPLQKLSRVVSRDETLESFQPKSMTCSPSLAMDYGFWLHSIYFVRRTLLWWNSSITRLALNHRYQLICPFRAWADILIARNEWLFSISHICGQTNMLVQLSICKLSLHAIGPFIRWLNVRNVSEACL